LQLEAWLLLTAYRKSLVPYPMVPTPIPYDLLSSHDTSMTTGKQMERRTDGRQPCQ